MFIGKVLPWFSPVLILALAANASAAPKIDLERVTPVPADQPIPTQDFFRPLLLSQPVLNPSGTHIAAVVAMGEDKHRLLVYTISNQAIETVGGAGEKDIYSVNWLNDHRLMFRLSTRKINGLGMLAADVGSLRNGYAVQQYSGSRLISVPLKNPLFPLVWNRSDIETGRDVGVVALDTNIKTGALVDLYGSAASREDYMAARENNDKHVVRNYPLPPPSGITYGYMADKTGELAYSFLSNDGRASLFRLEGQQWVKCPVDIDEIEIEGVGNEPGQLLVRGPRQDGKPRALQFLDPATGKFGDVVLQDQAYDLDCYLYRNPATGDVLGAYYHRNGPRVHWFNDDYRAIQKALDGMFPGLIARIYGSDTQHKIFLVATFSDKQPVLYHWVNLETRKAGLFQGAAPWIDPKRMQAMNIIKYKTRDGRQLDAYLTLPAGTTKTNQAPLVVLCHGGPWARDTWGFSGEVQFLASRGYAVLQPNYRGSTGYNWMFPEEDVYDFVKMHHDVTDSVQAAVNSGVIDQGRIGIMGGSFGGYLAVSGVAHEPALYRCAVTNAGVFDWAMQVQSEKYDRYDVPYYDYYIRKLGDPKKSPEKFAAMSPINFVDKIRVPVFVAGGKDDWIVEIQQSKALIAALDDHKVPYEKMFVGGEGHGMSYLKHEIELYDRILAFLDKNLMPKK